MKVLDKKSWDFICSKVGMDGDFTYDVYISGSIAGFNYTYSDNKMVCVYMADEKIPMIHIAMLYVKEKYRNKGLATNFINKLKEQSPCISLYLYTFLNPFLSLNNGLLFLLMLKPYPLILSQK